MEHDLLDPRSSPVNRYSASGSREPAARPRPRVPLPGIDEQVRRGSRSRARRSSRRHPVPSPPASASAFAIADSLAPVEPEHSTGRLPRPARAPAGAARFPRPAARAAGARRAARAGRPRARAGLQDEPRRRPDEPRGKRPLRKASPAFARPLGVRVRPTQPFRDPARDGADLLFRPRPAGASGRRPSRRCSTVRSSCVAPSDRRRPTAQVGVERDSEHRLELTGNRRRRSRSRRLDPEQQQLTGEKGPLRSVRSPRTSSLPVTTIAARGRATTDCSPERSDCAAGRRRPARRSLQLDPHVLGRAR